MQWLRERFTRPAGFQDAAEALVGNSAVMLCAEAGSGRRTAALMLLDETGHGRGYFHELSPGPDYPGDDPWDVSILDAGDRVLLDLSDANEEVHQIVGRELASYCEAVKARRARLVVVAHDTIELSGYHWLAARIERPDPMWVLARYLRVEGFTPDDTPPEPGLADFLAKEPVRTVVALADLMRTARSQDSTAGFEVWQRKAFTALTGGAEKVADKIRTLEPGRTRALMLVAAMFCGLPAVAAFRATALLLSAVDYPADGRHLLDRRDFAEDLKEIGARIDPQRRLQFEELAFDAAARTYFWDTVPDLRPTLWVWLSRAVRDPSLTADDRDELVRRFAEQCLRISRSGDLSRLVGRLARPAEPGRGRSLARHAVTALEQGLQDEQYGRAFRRQIYDWSISAAVTDGLARVAVEVCGGSLGESHPEQALLRLHNFTRRSDAVGELARRTVVEFVADKDRLLRWLLYRMAGSGRTEDRIRQDRRLFLYVADPHRFLDHGSRFGPMLADPSVRRDLVSGWRAAMRGGFSRLLSERLHDWLQAAKPDPDSPDPLDVLVEAALGDFSALSNLEAAAYAWALAPDAERPARAEVVRRLSRKIDTAPAPGLGRPDPDNATMEAAR